MSDEQPHDATLQRLRAAKRLLAVQTARTDLMQFMRLTMPDPEDPDDVANSGFNETPVARLLCQIMEKVYDGKLRRVAISIGPQLGKSQVLSRGGIAWMMGRNPSLNIILGTYNQPFAEEFGDEVRSIVNSPMFKQVFPTTYLRTGGQAKDLLVTNKKGRLAFVGRGGSGTGKPADVFLVDDPLKDDKEAQSETTRNETWNWFNKVAMTRCHKRSGIVIVHTRWSQDDLIGRLCDPDHPERNKKYADIADDWMYINLPAVVTDPKLAAALGLTLEVPTEPGVIRQFGSKPMAALVEDRKDLRFLAEAKRMDRVGFGALYMGEPTPDDGDFFKAEWLVEYGPEELPGLLEKYAASDHAVSTKEDADPTCMGVVGVDQEDTIWVLPDLVWERMQTDRTVEEILRLMRDHVPFYWWMESELISKSFGPFLHKRMSDENIYVPIDAVSVSKDKMTRARAIQGRLSMKKVRFPRFAPWWQDARKELLRFPNGTHDDFVDFVAHIGLGLQKQWKPSAPRPVELGDNVVSIIGSPQWTLRQTAARVARDKLEQAVRGW